MFCDDGNEKVWKQNSPLNVRLIAVNVQKLWHFFLQFQRGNDALDFAKPRRSWSGPKTCQGVQTANIRDRVGGEVKDLVMVEG